ncbi:MAG: YcxB family protein [Lachnospiraceae bacterium]|nr:YcxB family protein [Lachnospiraceae bacterium]
MVKFEYALDREKDLNCLVDYYLNTKENKKRRMIMRSCYLILALLLGVFTDLYLAVVGLVVLTFFLPELVQKKNLKKHFLSEKCDALYEKCDYTFSENGVMIESNVGLNEYNWHAYVDYSISENYLYIVRKGGALIVFNKERIGKDNYDNVLELVQQNIDKKDM